MSEQDLLGLSIIELQAKMLEPYEPERISMWPETQGWVWLAIISILLLSLTLLKWHKYRKVNAYRRAALAALYTADEDAVAIADIIRRTALVTFPRKVVVNLHGEDWLKFLDKTRGKLGFESNIGYQMLRAPYVSYPEPISGLNSLAVDWVKHHKLEALK